MQNRMIVGGHVFEVTSASLKGVAHERGFFWLLEAHAHGRIEGDELDPMATSDAWFDPVRPVRCWQDVLRKEVSWQDAHDSSDGQARGSLYLYTHEVIEKAAMRFSDLAGDKFRISWKGLTDSSAGCFDDYDEIVFDLDAEVTFAGVETRQLEEGSELAVISRYVTDTRFRLQEADDSGFKLFYPEPDQATAVMP